MPERRLSGQLYPFFRPNQRVAAAGAYFWDASGSTPATCRYAKTFWHLPLAPDADLADLVLANGIRFRCLEPLRRYAVRYLDPDDAEVEVDLVFEAIAAPNTLGASHLDQPGRYTGTLRLGSERIAVDAFGMRDRSWGPRSQFGTTLHPGAPYSHGGYSYATASPRDAFHTITAEIGGELVSIHGFLLRDGEWAKLVEGRREVLAREGGCPTRVRIRGRDALGRTLEAEGAALNRLGLHLNPNLWTWNCLTEWRWDGGRQGFGEDHDNWSAAAFRRFVRGETQR